MTGDGRTVGRSEDLCSFRLSINHGRPNWPRQPLLSLSFQRSPTAKQGADFFPSEMGRQLPVQSSSSSQTPLWWCLVTHRPLPPFLILRLSRSLPPSVHALPTLSPDSLLPPPFPHSSHSLCLSPRPSPPDSLFSLSLSLHRLTVSTTFVHSECAGGMGHREREREGPPKKHSHTHTHKLTKERSRRLRLRGEKIHKRRGWHSIRPTVRPAIFPVHTRRVLGEETG